jgi:hypothetical protein
MMSQGVFKVKSLTNEKWKRIILKIQGQYPRTIESSKTIDAISDPKHYTKRRSHTESPPPKSKRTNSGINRGNAKVCSHCRPAISIRMYNTADIRKYLRQIINDPPKNDAISNMYG